MADIAQWLQGLGLGKYADAFAENDVDLDVLLTLSEADLKELGLSLGHRRKLQVAIEEIAEAGPEEPSAWAAPKSEAERRQLTVMFCDLVGSTALSHQSDPEEFRAIIQAFQETCSRAVREEGGYVAKHLGDGLMAYFGYPKADEDDAARAARAALAVVREVANLWAAEPLRVRAGLETGLVVVGEMVGQAMSQEGEISGDAPNLAARLQGLAEPGEVLVGPIIRRVLGRAFEVEPFGTRTLKGIDMPVPVFRVVGEAKDSSRFEARQMGRLTEFVGRDAEMGVLIQRWEEANDSEGQVVLISGEPGIGKSRLAHEFRERIAAEPHVRLRYQCAPQHRDSTLYPFITQLTIAAGIEIADSHPRKLDKLEKLIRHGGGNLPASSPLLADLLSIPFEERYKRADYTPQRRREETLNTLMNLFVGLAAQQPVFIIYEDVHWIDATSQELLDMMVAKANELQALLLITFRPEFAPPWAGWPNVTTIPLNRLGRRLTARITAGVAGDRTLSEDVVAEITAKTEGVPLFVEELTKAILEAGSAVSGPSFGHDQIPATLKDSLTARLDRLGAAREVAQTGAVLGRTFSKSLIAALLESSPETLDDALGQLVDAELLFRRSTPTDEEYTFKHALIQDAAYESLLKSSRRTLHARAAASIAEQSPDTAETQPELLAHHYTEAALAEPAIDYWLKAGKLAIARSASLEAVRHLQRGLDVLMSQPESLERDQKELALQVALGPALVATKGYASPEVGGTYQRARELCSRVGESSDLLPVLFGIAVFHLASGQPEVALEDSQRLVEVAGKHAETLDRTAAHSAFGLAAFAVGKFDEASASLTEVVGIYDRPKHAHLAHRTLGVDMGTFTLAYSAWALWMLGDIDLARKRADNAVELGGLINNTYTRARGFYWDAVFRQFIRDWRGVRTSAENALSMAREHGFSFVEAAGEIMLGWAEAQEGRSDAAEPRLRAGIAAYRAAGGEFTATLFMIALAQAMRNLGRPAEGLEVLDDALALVDKTGERFAEAEIHRERGETILAIAPDDHESADVEFKTALSIASAQGAKSLALRAGMSRAKLWRVQGRPVEARELLGPICGWFTEGFDTPDLKEAKALLDELG